MNFIVAADKNYAIGNNGKLLYHIPADLEYFKHMTLNKVVVMGSKTFLSLPKHPLPNRTNIVLSKHTSHFEGAITVHDLDELAVALKDFNDSEVFVIGGGAIYKQLISYCEYGYVTKIYANTNADTFIENMDISDNWILENSSPIFTENNLDFQFLTYKNLNVKRL